MYTYIWGFPGGSMVKDPATNAGDLCSIPWSGRSPGGGHARIFDYIVHNIPSNNKILVTLLINQHIFLDTNIFRIPIEN